MTSTDSSTRAWSRRRRGGSQDLSFGHELENPRPPTWWASRQPAAPSRRNGGCQNVALKSPTTIDGRSTASCSAGEAVELVAPVSEVLERIGRVDHVQLDTVSNIDQRGGGPVEGGRCRDLGERVAAPDRRPAGGRFGVLETERERARQRADVETTRVRGRVLGERQHVGVEGGDDPRQFGRAAVVVQQIAVEHPQRPGIVGCRRFRRPGAQGLPSATSAAAIAPAAAARNQRPVTTATRPIGTEKARR